MDRAYFKGIENHVAPLSLELQELLDNLSFNQAGLIPAIAQDAVSREVLMMAWMNLDAIRETLRTQEVTYWSRSRQQLWKKGATSGHIQKLKRISIDCDGDTILCEVEQLGAACHTNRHSCFYIEVELATDVVRVHPL